MDDARLELDRRFGALAVAEGKKDPRRAASHLAVRNVDGGERGRDDPGELDVVEAGDRDIAGYREAGGERSAERADGEA